METAPDYELIESVKSRLKNIRDIIVGAHVLNRFNERLITEEQIKSLLWDPKNLVNAEAQKDEISEKYRLVFRKSGKYDLIIVIRFINLHLKIITAHIQNKKRTKITEKWRKRLRFRR